MTHHPVWHIGGICLVLVLAAINRRSRSSGVFILALWNLAGVILHELAHLLAGIVLGAGPNGISLIPRRQGNRWRLGSVSFSRVTALNAVPVALAPLGLAGIAYLISRYWFAWFSASLTTTLALYASCFVLLYNALPSRQDLRVACNVKSILVYAPPVIVGAIYCAWPTIKPFLTHDPFP